MKHIFPLLAVAVVIGMSSCSSSRNTQSSDDIYYSTGSKKAAAGGSNQGDYYSTSPSDNYVRMKAEDGARWSQFDDYSAYDSYYAPVSASVGYGYGYPAYGFGYGLGYGMGYPMYGMGLGFGYGLGFGDPYMCWNSYFLWNSWYNPYFYNPYYGGGAFVVGHGAPTAIYSNLRPFNSVAYRNGIAAHTTTGTRTSNGRFYRPGMNTTSGYNSSLSGQGRAVNNSFYRPGNTNNNGGFRPASFGQPTRSFSPAPSGGGGGGFSRPGRH